MATTALKRELVRLADQRELWRRLHEQGDQAGVHRLLEDPDFKSLSTEAIPASIPKSTAEKLTAFGREWERAIAVMGARDGAQFCQTEIHLDPSRVVQFQAVVEERLKKPSPWGIFLFVESAVPLVLTKESWKAIAHFLLAPGRQLSELEISNCPGVVLP